MNFMIYLGIDPGLSGGLAALAVAGLLPFTDSISMTAISMPNTERDLWDWFRCFNLERCFATIERVSGYIGIAHPGSAMFKFGQSYGGLRMALIAANIPFEEVSPRIWQKGLSISSRGKSESKGCWKNRLKSVAQRLFPDVVVTLKTADALLIAEYCRRKFEGGLYSKSKSMK